MKRFRLTPVRLLLLAGIIGATVHFWPSNTTASPLEQPTTAAHETKKPKAPAVVAKLEGHASFNYAAPTKLETKPEIITHPPISQ